MGLAMACCGGLKGILSGLTKSTSTDYPSIDSLREGCPGSRKGSNIPKYAVSVLGSVIMYILHIWVLGPVGGG